MRTYLISYDLGVPESRIDYQKIKEYIDSFPDWMKPLQSQWFVVSDTKDAADIRTDLRKLMDSNDKILVLDVTNDSWATFGLDDEQNAWLRKNQ